MNKAAIMLCQGDIIAAKNQLNELLDDQSLRIIQTEASSDGMIPDYLIKTLVYFLIVTSKCTHPIRQTCFSSHLTLYRKQQDGKALDQVSPLRARRRPPRAVCLWGTDRFRPHRWRASRCASRLARPGSGLSRSDECSWRPDEPVCKEEQLQGQQVLHRCHQELLLSPGRPCNTPIPHQVI